MRTVGKRAWALTALLCLSLCLLCGCRTVGGREPEQGALVAAVGVDAVGTQVRVSLEVLLVSEGEGVERRVLSAVGADARLAYAAVTEGFVRELLFGHCAVLVLGDGITDETATAFLSDASLPPELQVVTAEDAHALLSVEALAMPAVGYELQAILSRCAAKNCRVFELTADPSVHLSRSALPRASLADTASGRSIVVRMTQDVSQGTS